MSFVAFRIVHAVGSCPPLGILGEVVVVDLLRLATPGLAGILELADEFLLLGVDADARVAAPAEIVSQFVDVTELPITFGVRLSRVQRLSVAAQPKLLLAQQSADGGRASTAIEFPR